MNLEEGRWTGSTENAPQIRRLIGRFPEMRESMRELPQVLRTTSSEKLKTVLKGGVLWAPMYELSFAQHVALGLYVLGQKDRIAEMAQAEDPRRGCSGGSTQRAQRSMSALIAEARDGDDESLSRLSGSIGPYCQPWVETRPLRKVVYRPGAVTRIIVHRSPVKALFSRRSEAPLFSV